MALTTTALNAHLRTIVATHFTANDAGLTRFLETLRDYAIAGGVNEKEAARTIARLAFQQVIGRAPTANDLHILTNHSVEGGKDVL